ncbi:site-specific DNA-methyltransferase [Flavobacterium psychrophilum]|uniref:site-specific DNA-methyltransferase n=1 Tax=Flavobacterium psychrophilum TaxID=96345 RepID=UPI0004E7E18A|nr:site-specific DNA-methyltransferase [Flavobacterium psychrophilum]AIJ37047.1 Type III restriction-modification system methylation subunit [Flavobacterium psychrophilum]AIN70975.1 type III restriction endonuclease subunit M [Flavobacterium psychrophilum FPG101]EKT4545882.1 site-specific DNA-methyltransferase [Flavobacterium psychrophilum]KUM17995.1 type III restriction endonuclease subunit M [Flavobacterium psychrophilum]MCB6003004.1 site-specific DNA-methyltransferase [Flavobacterium psychr
MPTLNWIGKEKVINHHQDVPYKILEPQYGFADGVQQSEPNDSGNKIIHGDNLEALKSLLPEYEGKIKCIYIDPPYNTGNESWVYNDNVNHPKIKKWLGEVVGKDGEDLTRHDKWLCMMYPRLKLLHKLLAKDGAIFISIDDNEQAHLKLLCDEIFGGNNFVADVIWQHSIQPKGYLGKFSIHHNHTLVYSKSTTFLLGNLTRTDEHNKAYSNPDNDPRGIWRTGDVRNALYRPNLIYDITTPSGKIINAPKNGWRWSKETLQGKIDTKEIIFNKTETNIIRKIYLENIEGRAPETIWFGQDVGTTRDANKTLKNIFDQEIPFDTPKPPQLIERILEICSDKNSIILDSFAGSGTTAHSVLNLNKQDGGDRKFILIEMEDYADSITAERVKRVINGYGNSTISNDEGVETKKNKSIEGTRGSFNYYQLGEPLFLEEDVLNEAVGIENILKYIWYSETRTAFSNDFSFGKDWNNENYRIGSKDQTDYYFYYTKDTVTTVDYDFMAQIKHKASQYIIYADNCLLEKDFMLKHHIIFKKIPRDITRF